MTFARLPHVVIGARALATALATVAAATVTLPTASDVTRPPPPPVSSGLAEKKDAAEDARPLLATLVPPPPDGRVMLDALGPAQPRFDDLLADRVTGTTHALDPKLLELLRALAVRFGADGPPRIEL